VLATDRPRLGFKSRPGRLHDLEKDQSLEGRTLAEAAGINLNVNDGWGDLIEQATRHETINDSN